MATHRSRSLVPTDKVSEQEEDEYSSWLLGLACGEGATEELPAKEPAPASLGGKARPAELTTHPASIRWSVCDRVLQLYVDRASTFDDKLQHGNVTCGVVLVTFNKSMQHVRPDKVSDG